MKAAKPKKPDLSWMFSKEAASQEPVKDPFKGGKRILCVDFDGPIHSYTSGWKGENIIPDPPSDDVIPSLKRLQKQFRIVVYSSRCRTLAGIEAIRAYLMKHEIPFDEVTDKKPPAYLTIDDRAVCFTGRWKETVAETLAFKHYLKYTDLKSVRPGTNLLAVRSSMKLHIVKGQTYVAMTASSAAGTFRVRGLNPMVHVSMFQLAEKTDPIAQGDIVTVIQTNPALEQLGLELGNEYNISKIIGTRAQLMVPFKSPLYLTWIELSFLRKL